MTRWIAKAAATLAALPLLFAAPVCAEAVAAAPAPASAPAPTSAAERSGPALWKVADRDTTIYLFGTVHVLPKDVEWLDATVSQALAESDIIVTELPIDPASELALQQLAMTLGRLPEGTTLRSLLTPEQTEIYEAALAKLGLPEAAYAQFDPLKPWFAGMTFSVLPLMQQGYSPDSGVEKVLIGKAGEKPRDALETPEFQLGLFDNLPQAAQIAFLMEAAASIDEVKSSLDRMVSEWLKGDADRLAAIMNEGMSDPVLTEALLYSRNANWAEWIAERMKQPGTVFIAVGAGHLAGERSVQDMLAAKGIAVARVK